MTSDGPTQQPGVCPGCGLTAASTTTALPPAELVASGPCYEVYGELLARDFNDHGYYRVAHQMVVDAYAAQHAGCTTRRGVQAVALCLMTLCLFVEEGVDPAHGPTLHQRMAANRPAFVWLSPPAPGGWLTVVDILPAQTVDEHEKLVRQWARQVWCAWSQHHLQIRQWNKQTLG